MSAVNSSPDINTVGRQNQEVAREDSAGGWTSLNYDTNGQKAEDDNSDKEIHASQMIPQGRGEDILNKGWRRWSCRQLSSLISAAKGAITDASLALIKTSMRGTKLIFVMGQSGTGKSTILKEMTGIDLKIGHGYKSGTLQHYVCPAIIYDEQYLFVDTGGFGAADLSDEHVFRDIMSCLSILGPYVTVSGLLYVHGRPGYRQDLADLRTIRFIECFCGPRFLRSITVLTSQWDDLSESGFKKECARTQDLLGNGDLARILNPPGRYLGASAYHHGFPGGAMSIDSYNLILQEERTAERGDELRELISTRYESMISAELQIVRELNQGIPLAKTQAAKVLASDVSLTTVQILNGNATLVSMDAEHQVPDELYTVSIPKPNEEATASDSAPKPSDNSGSRIEYTQPTWFERVCHWMCILQEASDFFREAREQGYQSSNRHGAGSGPSWNPLKWLRAWWNGL